jgi:hypothetical protein
LLQEAGSDLVIRVGMPVDVIKAALDYVSTNASVQAEVTAIWMTADEGA